MTGRKPNKKNEDYFNQRSLQSVYWAGFIAARGTIYQPRSKSPLVVIKVREAKEERLLKLLEHIEVSNIKINTDIGIPAKGREPVVRKRLTLASSQWAADLKNIYNLPSSKTELYTPNITDDLEVQAYLLGYLDVGAYVNYRPSSSSYNSFSIIISGHLEFLNWVKGYVDKWCPPTNRLAAMPTVKTSRHAIYSVASSRAINLYNLLSKLSIDKSATWNQQFQSSQKKAA